MQAEPVFSTMEPAQMVARMEEMQTRIELVMSEGTRLRQLEVQCSQSTGKDSGKGEDKEETQVIFEEQFKRVKKLQGSEEEWKEKSRQLSAVGRTNSNVTAAAMEVSMEGEDEVDQNVMET